MSAVVGRWRATYTPGDWVLLSGPTSLVLLEPPAPELSGLINLLWEEVVASASMTDLAGRLATHPLDSLSSFAAFFWTGDGMRSLVRGGVSVVDLVSGATVARGDGIQTWTEVGLGEVTQVLVETAAGTGTRLELPLVVGAVRASSVRLDASEAARVRSPQLLPAAENTPASAVETEDTPAPPAELSARASAGEPGGPDTQPLADPFSDEPAPLAYAPDYFANDEPYPADLPAPGEDWAAEPAPARALPPDPASEMETDDTELMPPPFSPPTDPMDEVSQHSMIMAVVCQYGHASAQNATSCRICGSPIAPQGPQLMPRPVLAVLRSSDGSTAELDRAVLIGRAPSGQRSSARAPKLMTVTSPGHDISRTHVEVAPDGWSVVVTDLNSTNGTILIQPDGVDREQLPPGDSVPVQLGSVVELGDGISVLVDYPQ